MNCALRGIYRNGLDKVNRLTLSVGESTAGVKVVIVPLATAKISEVNVGRQGSSRVSPVDAPALNSNHYIYPRTPNTPAIPPFLRAVLL